MVALESAPIQLDPRIATDQGSGKVFELMMNGLVTKDEAGGFVPDLAESWEVLDEGRRWRFHLRRDVVFHDGAPFGAADVVWTYGSIVDGSVTTAKKGAFGPLERVEAVDPFTVDFVTREPFGATLANLTSYVGVVPASRTPERQNREPVGTGPFRVVARTPDTVELAAFDRFFRGRPRLDRVVLREIPDATVRALELRKGSAQLVVNALPADVVPLFERDPRFAVAKKPGSNYVYLGLNLEDPVLRDVRVRRALAMALDRERLARTLWRGLGTPTETLLPAGHWARHEELPATPHDPAAAARLLDEAGYPDPDGPGGQPRLTIVYKTSTDETGVLQAQILQAMAAEAGIRARDPLARVRDFLPGRAARQVPALLAHPHRDRRSRSLRPALPLAQRAAGRRQSRALPERGARRAPRPRRPAHRSGRAAPDLPPRAGDRRARAALRLAAHPHQRRGDARRPRRLAPLPERRAARGARDELAARSRRRYGTSANDSTLRVSPSRVPVTSARRWSFFSDAFSASSALAVPASSNFRYSPDSSWMP